MPRISQPYAEKVLRMHVDKMPGHMQTQCLQCKTLTYSTLHTRRHYCPKDKILQTQKLEHVI